MFSTGYQYPYQLISLNQILFLDRNLKYSSQRLQSANSDQHSQTKVRKGVNKLERIRSVPNLRKQRHEGTTAQGQCLSTQGEHQQ